MSEPVVIKSETRTLVAAFRNKHDAAAHYRKMLEVNGAADSGIWPDLNHALLERWSRRGLEDIKRMAWLGTFRTTARAAATDKGPSGGAA